MSSNISECTSKQSYDLSDDLMSVLPLGHLKSSPQMQTALHKEEALAGQLSTAFAFFIGGLLGNASIVATIYLLIVVFR